MQLTPDWEFVADRVMGGVSSGRLERLQDQGRSATRLTGRVSLENNGGFLQMAFDLRPDGKAFDASGWDGLALTLRGNGEAYDIRLRTDQLTRPWQSYRTGFHAEHSWQVMRFPFTGFMPHRTEAAFDPARLRRIGILAIGREFEVDISVADVVLYGKS